MGGHSISAGKLGISRIPNLFRFVSYDTQRVPSNITYEPRSPGVLASLPQQLRRESASPQLFSSGSYGWFAIWEQLETRTLDSFFSLSSARAIAPTMSGMGMSHVTLASEWRSWRCATFG